MRHLVFAPIRYGHFFWCENRAVVGGCFRCKAAAYVFAFGFSLVLAAVEFYGGSRTQSLGLLSDAFHMLFDSLGYLIGLVALWYGYHTSHDHERFRKGQAYFVAVMGVLLIITATGILGEAYERLHGHETREILEVGLLLGIAVTGLVGNMIVLVMLFLLGMEHGGGGGHSRYSRDEILWANVSHTLGDTVSSVLVVANASIFVITDDPQWRFLDAIAAVCIAALLYRQAWKMLGGGSLKK
ncbi:MAG: cation diffusion facilitator family transporter [Patescibacteria group bacterium]